MWLYNQWVSDLPVLEISFNYLGITGLCVDRSVNVNFETIKNIPFRFFIEDLWNVESEYLMPGW